MEGYRTRGWRLPKVRRKLASNTLNLPARLSYIPTIKLTNNATIPTYSTNLHVRIVGGTRCKQKLEVGTTKNWLTNCTALKRTPAKCLQCGRPASLVEPRVLSCEPRTFHLLLDLMSRKRRRKLHWTAGLSRHPKTPLRASKITDSHGTECSRTWHH